MKVLKYILVSLLTAALIAGVVAVMYFNHKDRALISCNSLEINFTDSLKFVSKQNVRDYLTSNYGNYIGQRLDSVGLGRIEKLLERRSNINSCEAWITDDGVLHLSISQRAPVLRFNYGEGGYYIDEDGYIFPLHPTYTAPVRVIEGNIAVRPKSSYKGYAMGKDKLWIESMLSLHNYIEGSKNLRNMISRIYIDEKEDIVVQTDKGEEIFIIGKVNSLEEKFGKLVKYYSYIAPNKEGEAYKKVDLRYKKQIICRKDI